MQETASKLSFEDTAVAFQYKDDAALKKANFIFTLINHPAISNIATGLAKYSLKIGLPVKGLIKKTVFSHFCGGESIEDSREVIAQLGKFGVRTILDYSVEGEATDKGFNQTMEEILKTIREAKGSANIPFSVFKITGLASTELLEKINSKQTLTPEENLAWADVRERVERICKLAYQSNVSVLVDAEESWIQGPIDDLAYLMMKKFNHDKTIVFNTFQMYRVDALQRLKEASRQAATDGYCLGVKIVRGAYMEKERDRANAMGYADPIQPSKENTDNDFNAALVFCIENMNRLSLVCGSHNEYSNNFLTLFMRQHNIAPSYPGIWFSQLYGMSDNISFNLAAAGYNVAKYVPFGPVKSVMPYLIRRAEENTSVAGQSSRELILIRKEMKRRFGQ